MVELLHIASAGACRAYSTKSAYFYIFSGLLVCSHCGKKLSGCNSGKNECNKIYYYYRCNANYLDNSCDCKVRISEKKLKKYLLNNISREAEKYKVEYELSIKRKRKPTIDKRTIENKLARLRNLYINELIEIEDYKKEYDSLNSELQALDETSIENEKDFSKLEALLESDFQTMYFSLDNIAKRALWYTIIEKIIKRDDGRFDIFFR